MDRRTYLKRQGLLGLGLAMDPMGNIWNGHKITDDPARNAWHNLHDFTRKRYVFRYIEPSKRLPNVFIYGDSISIGYTEYTRCALHNQANVHRLHRNGGSSHGFIEFMETLRKTMFQPYLPGGWDFTWDLIHFNVGLHDLKYTSDGKLDKVNGTQVSSIDDYSTNLKNIAIYLKETWPNARLIFATTTPVPEGEKGRIKGDDLRFNKAAIEALGKFKEIAINDLHGFFAPEFAQLASGPGNVHFTKSGSRKLGNQVAETIASELGLSTVEIPDDAILQAREKAYLEKIQ